MSPHTIRSYRDTMILFLRFAAAETGRSIESLDVHDINADRLGGFLTSLEVERGNSIATRNARLAAMHSFGRFLIAEHPEYMDRLQQVVGLPFKRGGRVAPVEYLEQPEVEGVLESINRDTPSGRRDYALFSLMFNTGARVQEILDIRVCDLRLVSPCQVRLYGKGNKVRLCPIWQRTAQLLQKLVGTNPPSDNPADQKVFLNDRGAPLNSVRGSLLVAKVRRCGREESAYSGGQKHPSPLASALDCRSPPQGRCRYCHCQSMAWSLWAERYDALCTSRYRHETAGAPTGFPRRRAICKRQDDHRP